MNKSVPKSQLLLWGIIMVLLLVSIVISITSVVVDSQQLVSTFYGKMLGPLATEVVLLVLYVHASVRYLQLRRHAHRYPTANDNNNSNLPRNLHHYHSLFFIGLTLLFAFVLLGVSSTRLFRYGFTATNQCRFVYYDTNSVYYDPKGGQLRTGLSCSMWVAQLWMGAITSLIIIVDTFIHGCKAAPRPHAQSSSPSSYEMGPPPPPHSASSQYYVAPVYQGQHSPPPPPGSLPPYSGNPPPQYQPPPPMYWQSPPTSPPPLDTDAGPPPPAAAEPAAVAATPPPVASSSTTRDIPSSPPPHEAQERK